jgi:hypothetical protein
MKRPLACAQAERFGRLFQALAVSQMHAPQPLAEPQRLHQHHLTARHGGCWEARCQHKDRQIIQLALCHDRHRS